MQLNEEAPLYQKAEARKKSRIEEQKQRKER